MHEVEVGGYSSVAFNIQCQPPGPLALPPRRALQSLPSAHESHLDPNVASYTPQLEQYFFASRGGWSVGKMELATSFISLSETMNVLRLPLALFVVGPISKPQDLRREIWLSADSWPSASLSTDIARP